MPQRSGRSGPSSADRSGTGANAVNGFMSGLRTPWRAVSRIVASRASSEAAVTALAPQRTSVMEQPTGDYLAIAFLAAQLRDRTPAGNRTRLITLPAPRAPLTAFLRALPRDMSLLWEPPGGV